MTDNFVAIEVTTEGMVDAITKLDRLDADLADMQDIEGQLIEELTEVLNNLIALTPVGRVAENKSGKPMADSWDMEVKVTANYEIEGRIFNTAPHARYVIQGTGEFGPEGQGILPVLQPVMVFFKEGRKVVVDYHRGQKPNAALNEYLDSQARIALFQASGRALRGKVQAIFLPNSVAIERDPF